MKIYSFLFTLGLIVVFMAFFDFPLPHFFDKWFFVIVGGLISFFSYVLMNGKRSATTLNGKNTNHEQPTL